MFCIFFFQFTDLFSFLLFLVSGWLLFVFLKCIKLSLFLLLLGLRSTTNDNERKFARNSTGAGGGGETSRNVAEDPRPSFLSCTSYFCFVLLHFSTSPSPSSHNYYSYICIKDYFKLDKPIVFILTLNHHLFILIIIICLRVI